VKAFFPRKTRAFQATMQDVARRGFAETQGAMQRWM
jgi:hypothetical protein